MLTCQIPGNLDTTFADFVKNSYKKFLILGINWGKTFERIDFIKRNILDLYESDLAKYDDENKEKTSDRYIIYTKDYKEEDGVTYIPIYMAGLL